ncbi:hypothetical protein [Tardiphaga robiniae]|uniref:hypothetical protein n=1 Tax=Tardiphaga robiniae TaxID=943830 RepID=UPI0015867B79|nr:hypothetical protein [Tardiphaga robiniae]NUU44234.1 hypothetical protein [Tardiphaga robiniae]
MSTYAWGLFAAVVAIVIPLTLLVMREVIRRRRSTMLTDLLETLFKDNPDIPTIEFARNKYGVRSSELRNAPGSELSNHDSQLAAASLTRTRTLLLSAVPYLLFSIAGFLLLIVPICALISDGTCGGRLIVPTLFWTDEQVTGADLTAKLLNSASIVGAAFLGGYLFTLRLLLRAVMNFELNPITWLRSAVHLIGGAIIALLLYRTLSGTPYLSNLIQLAPGAPAETSLRLWLAIAFVAGYVPDFGMVTLIRYLQINYLKPIDSEVLKSAATVPIEVIDGIDYDTRYRLEETNIVDIQNLATANPILLFVETPYGLYQSFDWVLQAQLCLVVGPRIFFELKKHNIRTILDLERAVLGDGAPDAYVHMIGSVVFSDAAPAQRGLITKKAATAETAPELDIPSIRHAVMVMADDLHVHRLRQLWNEIRKKLGEEWIYSKSSATSPP